MKYHHGTKIKYWVVCYMFYGVVGPNYVSINYLGVTKKQPQEINDNLDENKLITFHGTWIAYFLLHILSCMRMLNTPCGSILFTCNVDIFQYELMINLRKIYNISTNSQNDESQLLTNKLKKIVKMNKWP